MAVVMKGCIGNQSVSGDFTTRARRVSLKLPVIFEHDGGKATGNGTDISESGILVDCDQIMDLWTTGELSIRGELWHIRIQARVARVNGRQAALAFRDMTSRDRQVVRDLIAHVAP